MTVTWCCYFYISLSISHNDNCTQKGHTYETNSVLIAVSKVTDIRNTANCYVMLER